MGYCGFLSYEKSMGELSWEYHLKHRNSSEEDSGFSSRQIWGKLVYSPPGAWEFPSGSVWNLDLDKHFFSIKIEEI